MAIQQKGSLLSGKVGGKVYSNQHGKTVVKAQSKRPHRLSLGSLRSGKDLSEASVHSKNVRLALADLVNDYGDRTLYYRLTARFYDVLRPLPKSKLGRKKIKDGDINALLDFQFNAHCGLDALLFKRPTVLVDVPGFLDIQFSVDGSERISGLSADLKALLLQISLLRYDLETGASDLISMGDLTGDRLLAAKKRLAVDLKGNVLFLVVVGIQYLRDGYRSFAQDKFAAAITHAFRFKDGKQVFFKPVLEKVAPKVKVRNQVLWDE
ncbi:hypothetical protein [Pedobacter chitinilyticus]|uniref:Uncharacterized protein n=1 Tax=Pedobacter chitinilyticus TaxID=2233776 RepID=A0A3S3SRL6_9SPHI|nr:hypothetical protein [Pedobacter chitinilyticus]RWU03856.1 hypothetical protein DPV69_19405 [Pedobacter chitinilyticus]